MKKLRFRLPSPAMAVAVIALVMSMAGTSYAVKQINGKLIKNGTVTGAKIKKNSLTGTQVNEAKLGKVPSAGAADSATTAAKAADADKLGGASAAAFAKSVNYVHVYKRMNIGDADVTLVTNGDIAVKARCAVDGANDRLYVYATTGTNGALLDSQNDDQDPLDTTTAVADAEISEGISDTSGSSTWDNGYDDTGYVISSDGARIITYLEGSGTKVLNKFGNDCIFAATFIVQ